MNCRVSNDILYSDKVHGGWYTTCGLILRKLVRRDEYARVQLDGKWFINFSSYEIRASKFLDERIHLKEFTVQQKFDRDDARLCKPCIHGFHFPMRRGGIRQNFNVKAFAWDEEDGIALLQPGDRGDAIDIDLAPSGECIEAERNEEKICGIRFLRVGFDFDYNPVCFAAINGDWDHARVPDGPVAHFRDAVPRSQATSPVVGIFDRSPLDDSISCNQPSSTNTWYPIEEQQGVWAMKAGHDRCFFELSDETVSLSRCVIAHVSINRITRRGSECWEVEAW